MSDSTSDGPARADAETRSRICRLAFGGDEARFQQFLDVLHEVIPPTVTIILRGSAVTGTRWEDGAPFDADGPGTSDVDLTFVGGNMVKLFEKFYIPGLHSEPLCDGHEDVSPTFAPLRRALCTIARRPVNIQATADVVQYVRDVTMNQPYYVLVEKQEEPPEDEPSAS